MAFSDEVVKNPQDPIVLQEISQNITAQTWRNYEPGIWYTKLTLFGEGPTFGDFWELPDTSWNRQIYNVNQFTVDGEDYTEVGSLASLRTQNESWYFDSANTFLYVHFDNFDPYYAFDFVQVGIVLAFTSYHLPYTNEDGLTYKPIMSKAPVINIEADDIFNGILRYDGFSIELDNTREQQNSLDDFAQRELIGNSAATLLGYPNLAYSEFRTMFTGKVNDIPNVSQNKIVVEILSNRAFLTQKINTQYYSNTDATADYYYANMSDDDADKPVALLFGDCKRVPCINLDTNESPAPTNYTYKVCATDLPGSNHFDITAIDTVYVDGVEKSIVGAADLVNGTFEIAGTDVKDGTSFLTVTADVRGYKESGTLIENPLRIIEILLDVYENISYISDNYNTTEWEATKLLVKDSSIYIGEDRERIIDVIEKLGARWYFIEEGDGRYTARVIDNDLASQDTIRQHELYKLSSALYDRSEILSDATCLYQKRYDGDGFIRQYTDTSRQTDVNLRYQIKEGKKFDTQLVNRADAVTYASEVMDESELINPRFPCTTFMQYLLLEIIKNVNVEVNRLDKSWFGTIKGRLIKQKIDLNKFQIDMVIKYLEDV